MEPGVLAGWPLAQEPGTWRPGRAPERRREHDLWWEAPGAIVARRRVTLYPAGMHGEALDKRVTAESWSRTPRRARLHGPDPRLGV